MVIANVLTLSYLSESEHFAGSVLEDNGNLSQVGGALPEQMLLRAAGWSKERQLSPKLLCPVLHFACWRVRGVESHTQSDHNLTECRCGCEVQL